MKRLITTAVAVTALVLGAAAFANVLVYKNAFKKRDHFQQIAKFDGGRECGKSWKGKKSLGVSVKEGKHNCGYRTPVESDGKRPDHTIQVIAKLLKQKTHKSIRKDVYVGVALRANLRSQYELRVFPGDRTWELLKSGDVIESGKEKSIEKLNTKNKLRLIAEGARVTAKANGTTLGTFKDQSPEEVSGRKTLLTFGNTKKSKKDAEGLFDKVRIFVPDP